MGYLEQHMKYFINKKIKKQELRLLFKNKLSSNRVYSVRDRLYAVTSLGYASPRLRGNAIKQRVISVYIVDADDICYHLGKVKLKKKRGENNSITLGALEKWWVYFSLLLSFT